MSIHRKVEVGREDGSDTERGGGGEGTQSRKGY